MCVIVAFAPAGLSLFGRIRWVYLLFAHVFAMAPGAPGNYLRIAYYRLTLEQCRMASCIEFGSYFAHPEARIADGVYIGSYCILGRTSIGARTQVASGVQILSGRQQHARDEEGRIQGSESGHFVRVEIGADCWIGAAAIVMADVGEGSTIGAGAVVVKSIPAGSVAVGNPARVIRTATGADASA